MLVIYFVHLKMFASEISRATSSDPRRKLFSRGPRKCKIITFWVSLHRLTGFPVLALLTGRTESPARDSQDPLHLFRPTSRQKQLQCRKVGLGAIGKLKTQLRADFPSPHPEYEVKLAVADKLAVQLSVSVHVTSSQLQP